MTSPATAHSDAYTVRVLTEPDDERARAEKEALAAGIPLPAPHRTCWAEMQRPARSWFFDVRDRQGAPRGAFAAEVNTSRVLPGFLLLRVERFGTGITPEAIPAALAGLCSVARSKGKVLRANVESFSRDPVVRDSLSKAFTENGFTPVEDRRRYARTLELDLTPDEEGILASLHGTARRHIRALGKHPVEIRPITDPAWAPRMSELIQETMDRTGGGGRDYDWLKRIAFTNANPENAILLGLFRTDKTGPESLLAFAWTCHHGDHAHYDAAASTRNTDLKLPLNYALAWELIRWSKARGATWYDFGGVTEGTHGDDGDRLGGISDFKRYFTKNVIDVGGEWVFEPSKASAKVASALSAVAARARSYKQKLTAGRGSDA